MTRFPEAVAAELLALCKRHCCICLRWRGRNLGIHHIEPAAEGGQGTLENGIPVCFDCHAEIESKSNMGRRFTPSELRRHQEQWFGVVREHPEKLLGASRMTTESGPLEALLAELGFNLRLVAGAEGTDYPPLEVSQFRRAIAANALAVLPPDADAAVSRVYGAVGRINYQFERLLHLTVDETAYKPTVKVRNELRNALRDQLIPHALEALESALGKTFQGVR